MNKDQWIERYCPLPNSNNKCLSFKDCSDSYLIKTTESKIIAGISSNKIWTMIKREDRTIIVAGYDPTNRIGHFKTKKPWITGKEEVEW